MSTLFERYSFGILDASLFMARDLTEELRDGLRQLRLYAAGETFTAELMEYEAMLTGEKLAVYHLIADYVNQTNAPFEEPRASGGRQVYDTLDLVCQMAKLYPSNRFVVITGNELLIQRIILSGVRTDIYDLRHLRFKRFENFTAYRRDVELRRVPREPNPNAVRRRRFSEDTPLYGDSGAPVRLEGKIGDGLESWLFRLAGRRNLIAKIFRDFTPEKVRNIRNLLQFPAQSDISWAILPESMIYYDRQQRRPAGVVEPYLPGRRNLGDEPLYAGDLDGLSEQDLSRKLSETVSICLSITRQICFLEHYGFFVSDFNIYNFSRRQGSDSVLMYDTDSFGYLDYFSGNQADIVTAHDYDKRTKEGVLDFCDEALYAFIFKLLSLGDSAVDEKSRAFRYDLPDLRDNPRRRLFPSRVLTHMADVFRGKAKPSPPALLCLLSEAYTRLRDNPDLDGTYAALTRPENDAAYIQRRDSDMTHPSSSHMDSGSQVGRRISMTWNTRQANVRNSSKRLPIIFCLDVSPSMERSVNGSPSSMDLLNDSVRNFISQLSSNAKARAAAMVAFVTFSTGIEEDLDFQSVPEIEEHPRKFVSVQEGGTRMANAVLRSIRKIEDKTEELANSGISYYAPFLVVVTDGNPQNSDNPLVEKKALSALKRHTSSPDPADMIVPIIIGVGDEINSKSLLPYAQDFMRGPFHIRGNARNTRQAFETLFHALIKSVTDSLRSNGANQNLEAITAALEEAAHLIDTGSPQEPDIPPCGEDFPAFQESVEDSPAYGGSQEAHQESGPDPWDNSQDGYGVWTQGTKPPEEIDGGEMKEPGNLPEIRLGQSVPADGEKEQDNPPAIRLGQSFPAGGEKEPADLPAIRLEPAAENGEEAPADLPAIRPEPAAESGEEAPADLPAIRPEPAAEGGEGGNPPPPVPSDGEPDEALPSIVPQKQTSVSNSTLRDGAGIGEFDFSPVVVWDSDTPLS